MPKISNFYLEVDPFKIIEKGFHKDRAQVSESIFSLGNEYSGIRGFFDEGYSGERLQGSYFNGIYEYALEDTPNAYKGIVKRTHFTINSVNWVKCKISIDDEVLDLNVSDFSDFYRELDMKNGLYTRSFIWNTKNAKIKIVFSRLMDMIDCHHCVQRITFVSDKDVDLDLSMSLDNNVLHWGSDCYWNRIDEYIDDYYGLSAKTLTTNQSLVSLMKTNLKEELINVVTKEMEVIANYKIKLIGNKKKIIDRIVVNIVDKNSSENIDTLLNIAKKELVNLNYEKILSNNTSYFNKVWENSDIEISGDDKNQQGIRYCIFQLEQTYHGYAKDNNIGAKGLTGEAYSGHAFWDSETYCLPYYLFSNQEAAKNLIMFRYNTMNFALERAKELDCDGACFPIATRNGKEACNLWQHASLQFQPSTAVFYAIEHYMNLYNDIEFMKNYGLEMIVEISKFLLSRGQYNSNGEKFSFYNVMGPDEFQMMVNHNTYTNYMAKKVFDYLIKIIESNKYDVTKILAKCNCDINFINKLNDASNKMVILYDENTKLFEQHDGFFDLPHIDINSIPKTDFPLYSHWSYDRIYRNDMIKQPDVLMFMFLYNQDFTLEQKRANYEFYEPKCIHESSLSPSIHSIFACELGKIDEAKKFFEFATRLDLDDYNCNTKEGIHTTSIAAAWMNIVYGFGGLRSEREMLLLNPIIVDDWNYYSFRIKYHGSSLKITVYKDIVNIENKGKPISLIIYDKKYDVLDKLEIKTKNV
ncbi:MAG: family 65 glycosyl hydrolase [Bacilli bacterium]|nr:family 65 glycosyl hydrolase [Bacilli bacterium]